MVKFYTLMDLTIFYELLENVLRGCIFFDNFELRRSDSLVSPGNYRCNKVSRLSPRGGESCFFLESSVLIASKSKVFLSRFFLASSFVIRFTMKVSRDFSSVTFQSTSWLIACLWKSWNF